MLSRVRTPGSSFAAGGRPMLHPRIRGHAAIPRVAPSPRPGTASPKPAGNTRGMTGSRDGHRFRHVSEQTGPDAAGSLFDYYTLGAAWDEMLAEPGAPRTAYKPVFHTLRAMNAGTLKERADTLARSYLDQGVTFDYAGEERPFPLDAVPAGHLGGRVAGHRGGRRAAGHGPGGVPRRRLLARGRDPARGARGRHPVAADRQLDALPPRGRRHPARPTACACTSPAST